MSDYYCIAGTRHRVPVCLEDEGVLQRKRHVIIDMTLVTIIQEVNVSFTIYRDLLAKVKK